MTKICQEIRKLECFENPLQMFCSFVESAPPLVFLSKNVWEYHSISYIVMSFNFLHQVSLKPLRLPNKPPY